MKRPQPDLNKNIVDTFVAKTGANRKLKRLWGTSIVNGVEVLNARRHYHKEADRPENYKKLFKFLKVYDDVKDYEGKGIKSAWFTLNKSNGPENLDVSSSYIADNLNKMWWDINDGPMPEGLTLTTTITIGLGLDTGVGSTLIDRGEPKEQQALAVKDNYETLWNEHLIEQEGVGIINKGSVLDQNLKIEVPDEDDLSPDDPWLSIISRYILRDAGSGIPCTIRDIEVGLGNNGKHLYNTAVVTIEIPYHEFTTSDPIVQKILGDLDTGNFQKPFRINRVRSFNGFMSSNEHVTQASAKQVNYYETEDDIDLATITRSYIQWEDSTIQASVYESFWLQDGDKWYFRADVIDNPKSYGTTHIELNTYLFSLLDTGYKKKKVSFWKKLVAVIVFIIAVVLAFVPGAQGASAWLMAASYAVLIGSLVLALITMTLSALGANEWAMAFAAVSKEIEPLVTVASIIMVVGSFYTAISEAGTNAAAEAIKSGATKEAAATAASEAIKSSITTTILDSVVNTFLGTSASSIMAGSLTTTQIVSVTNKAVSVYTNLQVKKLENIASKNNDLKTEYDKLVEETSMETDIMRGYMNIYAKPATADWSVYASTFDMPYERGGGVLAMGNIQKTTKQAIRKADYDEPMFESMNLA